MLIALTLTTTLVGLVAVTTGCDAIFEAYSRPVERLTGSTDVMVSFAENGERGDLPGLLARHPGLGASLAKSLAPLVHAEAKGHSRQSHDTLVVAGFTVVGAATGADGVRLFADASVETFGFGGGRLFEGADNTLGGPLVIRLSGSLRPQAFEYPDYGDYCCDDDDAYVGLMPEWAWHRAESLSMDAPPLREAASRWVERSGRTVELVNLPRPRHADPHQHRYDVYALGAIPAKVNGFSISRVRPPRLWGGGPMTDQQRGVSRSPDGRFTVYWPRARPSLLVHDARGDRWLHLDGPGLYTGCLERRWAWTSDTLAFDVIDMDAWQSPREKTMAHIEVDWAARRVTRVVPIGPYTGNRRQ